jgi:hypothetical protein
MSATHQAQVRSSFGRRLFTSSLVLTALTGGAAAGASAQQAIGVPFTGKNHLSFYTTELSRDGVGSERAAIFGGAYGRAFGDPEGPLQISVIVRAGARAFEDLDDGILDAALTLAATRSMPGLEDLSASAAAGVGAMVWGQGPDGAGAPDSGRSSKRVPLSTGAAYDIRLGGATVAPFAMVTAAYTRDGDYLDDERIALDSGWRVGNTTGVSVRFKEMVLSVADVRRERGLPHGHRIVFGAGMSW